MRTLFAQCALSIYGDWCWCYSCCFHWWQPQQRWWWWWCLFSSCQINRGEFVPPPATSTEADSVSFRDVHRTHKYIYIFMYYCFLLLLLLLVLLLLLLLLAFFQFSWNRILLNVSCNTVYSISLDQFTATHYILSKKKTKKREYYDIPFGSNLAIDVYSIGLWLVGSHCSCPCPLHHSLSTFLLLNNHRTLFVLPFAPCVLSFQWTNPCPF